ncbi:MAG TPA: ATP synthase F1 subunit delta [Spirochaetes bacterium]|nr:ATP synthase F1 subunit delta [Spirochaetota bacterium]
MTGRYEIGVFAHSLFKLGIQMNRLDDFYEEFTGFIEVYQKAPELGAVLASPRIDRDDKKGFLNRVFDKWLSKELIAFINVILHKQCQPLYKSIYRAFQELVDDHKNVARAKVYSVHGLNEKTLEQISQLLSERYHKKVMLTPVTDEKILGGLVVEIGDIRIDMSVAHSLEGLKDKILGIKTGVKG